MRFGDVDLAVNLNYADLWVSGLVSGSVSSPVTSGPGFSLTVRITGVIPAIGGISQLFVL